MMSNQILLVIFVSGVLLELGLFFAWVYYEWKRK
jgi:hypothetical protein